MGFLVLCAVIGVGVLAAMAWAQREGRRAARREFVKERAQAARFEALRAETEAAMARSAGRVEAWKRLPKRPTRPVSPECLIEAEVAQDAVLLIAAATRLCRRDAELRANTALMDEYAAWHPMKQRPSLVERQAVSDNNPQVETS